jgi:tRNA G18 (ribose-2'-O)-methylase SpoU
MNPLARWHFAECQGPACRYRFPVETSQIAGLCCPRCGGALAFEPAQAADTRSSSPPPPELGRLSGLLDNIRSIHNTGSMFRTADGAGLSHLYLCGITPTPEHPRLAKAALGAESAVPWSHHLNGVVLADSLTAAGHELWALERTGNAPVATMPPIPAGTSVVLVVGNEKAGVDPALLSRCRRVIALPMVGTKGSLNAAVAFGIAVYGLRFAGAPA